MFYLNIHYWKHSSSFFKYSKKKDLSKQTCRYRKPDWTTFSKNIITLRIGKFENILNMEYTINQRRQYVFLSESMTRLMITFFANHCVKLVTDACSGSVNFELVLCAGDQFRDVWVQVRGWWNVFLITGCDLWLLDWLLWKANPLCVYDPCTGSVNSDMWNSVSRVRWLVLEVWSSLCGPRSESS